MSIHGIRRNEGSPLIERRALGRAGERAQTRPRRPRRLGHRWWALTLALTLALIPTPTLTLTRYDADASGQLTYTQFAHGLYAEEAQAREQSAGGGVNPSLPSFSRPSRPGTAQGGQPLQPLQSSRPSSSCTRGRSMGNPAGPPEPDAFKRSSGIFR